MAGQAVRRDTALFVAGDTVVHAHHKLDGLGRGREFALVRMTRLAIQPCGSDVSAVREEDVGPNDGYALPWDVLPLFVVSNQLGLLWVVLCLLVVDVMAIEARVLIGQPGPHLACRVGVAVGALEGRLFQVDLMIESDGLGDRLREPSKKAVGDGNENGHTDENDDKRTDASHISSPRSSRCLD